MAASRHQRSPRLRDVARHAGVSMGTVSNVLNHPAKVSQATIDRVRESIEALGFVRDANASSLAAGGSSAIGMVVIDLGNSIFVDAARGAQATARAAGLNVLVAGCDNDFEVQSANVDWFNEARVSGLLLAPLQDSSEQIARMAKRGHPTVVMNYDPGNADNCCVVIDNEQVGYLAARTLIDLGCDQLAVVGAGSELQPVQLRRQGIRRAVAESAGAVRFEEILTEDLNTPAGMRAGLAIGRRGPGTRPNGVIAMTDTLGVGVVRSLVELGIDVPGEISVIGCDSNTSSPDSPIPLSTIDMRGYDMGSEAMRLLMDEPVGGEPHVHQRVVLEPSVIVRGTTGPLIAREPSGLAAPELAAP